MLYADLSHKQKCAVSTGVEVTLTGVLCSFAAIRDNQITHYKRGRSRYMMQGGASSVQEER